MQFKPAPAAELAKLVDEASREKPEIFNNLQSHPKMHKQVSMALLTIIKGEQYRRKQFVNLISYLVKLVDKLWSDDQITSERISGE